MKIYFFTACDAGCHINTAGRKRFNEYITMLSNPNTFTLDFQLRYSEYQYMKQEAFDWFASGPEITNSKQLHATVIILKKCQHSCFLINSWYDAARSILFYLLMKKEKLNTLYLLITGMTKVYTASSAKHTGRTL
jgi:hypothetical protein